MLGVLAGCSSSPQSASVGLETRAREFYAAEWSGVLGGDAVEGTSVAYAGLNELSNLGLEAGVARGVVTRVLVADLTGSGREEFASYFNGVPAGACSNVSVIGASPFSMGVIAGVEYVKAVAAWSGSCPAPPSAEPVFVSTLYLQRGVEEGGVWTPVREGVIPQPAESAGAGDLPEWALGPVSCSTGVRARWEVAAAWETMCGAAAADGVALVAHSGWRSAGEQANRFAGAVEFYGSRDEAERYVAFSDRAACASRHCAGEALDVQMDPAASAWLREVVGCRRSVGGVVIGAACRADERPITQMEQYGFVEPLASSPGHLEYVLPVNAVQADGCEDSTGGAPAAIVASVFRCTLRELGVASDDTVREALVVAECESGLNPRAEQLQGAYRNTTHPQSGRRYEGAGLFGLTRVQVSEFVAGGAHLDPWANALAAARLFVNERQSGRDGWGAFVCARGDAAVKAVLPQQAWPGWVLQYVPAP
jgi:hypothetical protein